MKTSSHIVTKDATRPAIGYMNECYICGAVLGEEHKQGCVFRKRTIIIEVKINLLVSVPEDWDTEMVEFHFNESSYCSSNLIDELKSLRKRVNCICPFTEITFVREATEEDEEYYGFDKEYNIKS